MIRIHSLSNTPYFFDLSSIQKGRLHLHPHQKLRARVLDMLPQQKVRLRLAGRVVELQSQLTFRKNEVLLLQVLPQKGGKLRLKLLERSFGTQGMESVAIETFGKDLKTLQHIVHFDEKLKKEINRLLLQRKLQEELLEASKIIKKIFHTLNKEDKRLVALLKTNFLDIENLDAKELKELLLDMHKTKMGSFKSMLSMLQEHRETKELERLLYMLDTYALVAQASGMIMSFLPVIWDEVEESELVIKKLTYAKVHFCRLYLRFHNNDKVLVSLILHKGYLQVVFGVEEDAFREKLAMSMPLLKKSLAHKGIYVHCLVKEFCKQDLLRGFEDENLVNMKL
ncbi:hypothetical protein [Nitratiruptor tergarcus]|uniref:hypothetical protein n=1 Tax=Nitratiruptor tergarcus TaxID=269259 RepID=UPI0011816D57|nr:hypothetical protein [Nitratiruptor tergarcus]